MIVNTVELDYFKSGELVGKLSEVFSIKRFDLRDDGQGGRLTREGYGSGFEVRLDRENHSLCLGNIYVDGSSRMRFDPWEFAVKCAASSNFGYREALELLESKLSDYRKPSEG